MTYRRLFLDDKDRSVFGPFDPEMTPRTFLEGVPDFAAGPDIAARRLYFLDLPTGWQGTWHPSPCRQVFVFFSGSLRMEVSETCSEVFTTGDVLLMENTRGKGHRSTVESEVSVSGMLVQLEVPDEGGLKK